MLDQNVGQMHTPGRHDQRDAARVDTWMDIMTGKADGQQMFMEQKYTVEGDIELLMKMRDLFAR